MDIGNDVLVSVASLWEIVVKVRVGKLEADVREVIEAIGRNGFVILGISTHHLVTLSDLPRHHRDPFDHLLIAQAISEEAAFVTGDRNAGQYPVQLVGCS